MAAAIPPNNPVGDVGDRARTGSFPRFVAKVRPQSLIDSGADRYSDSGADHNVTGAAHTAWDLDTADKGALDYRLTCVRLQCDGTGGHASEGAFVLGAGDLQNADPEARLQLAQGVPGLLRVQVQRGKQEQEKKAHPLQNIVRVAPFRSPAPESFS
jgi:hypothetical protein